MHTCTLHNNETLEPLTWIRVRPSHCYKHSLPPSLSHAHTCFVLWILNISRYMTFKPITWLVLLYINLAIYLTLHSTLLLRLFLLTIVTSCGISTGRKESWSRGKEKINTNMKSFRLEVGFEPMTCCFSHEYIKNNNLSEFSLKLLHEIRIGYYLRKGIRGQFPYEHHGNWAYEFPTLLPIT